MGKRLEDLTLEDAKGVMSHFGLVVPLNDELLRAGVALLNGQDIHSVADMIQHPESIQTLIGFVTRGVGSNIIDIVPEPVITTDMVHIPMLHMANPGWRLPS